MGKALRGFIIGFFEATLIIVISVLWFQVPLRGSLLTLYAGLFFFLLSTVGLGLMISSLSVTQQQGLLGAFLFIVPSVILSGLATPIANMPPWVQQFTLINPMRYFLVILRGVYLQGTPVDLLVGQFWPMAIIGVVNLALAGFLFRRPSWRKCGAPGGRAVPGSWSMGRFVRRFSGNFDDFEEGTTAIAAIATGRKMIATESGGATGGPLRLVRRSTE